MEREPLALVAEINKEWQTMINRGCFKETNKPQEWADFFNWLNKRVREARLQLPPSL